MSRMRLMEARGPGAGALVCLYCGAETESKPPYEVVYCYCRTARVDRDAVPGGTRNALPCVGQAA